MAIVFRKVIADNIIETTLRKFVTETEKGLIGTALQPGTIGVTVQAYNEKLQAATLLTGNIVGTDDTQTITNKTIDAASNTLSNLTTGMFAAGVISTSGTLVENSDTVLATQKAVKTYVDNAAAATTGALLFKGDFDASLGAFPTAANLGYYYKVTVAGIVDGISFAVGDTLFAVVDAASTTTYAGNWFKIDNTENVSSVAGKTGAVTLVISDITDVTATATEINYLSGVTSSVQTQLDNKLDDSQLATAVDLGGVAASDANVPSQLAVKTYVDTAISNVSAIAASKVSAALTVSGTTITLAENAVLVSSIYVDQIGTVATGFSHTSETATITLDDTSLDTKTVYVTYSI